MREKHFNNLYCVFFILRKMPWFVAVTILHSLWSSMTAYVNNVFLLQKILYILEYDEQCRQNKSAAYIEDNQADNRVH